LKTLAIACFFCFCASVLAQTQSDTLVVKDPPKVSQQENKVSTFFDDKSGGFFDKQKDNSGLKLKEGKQETKTESNSSDNYFRRRNFIQAQFHYVQSENDYTQMSGMGGYLSVSQKSVVGNYVGAGIFGGEYNWKLDRSSDPDFYYDWRFKGEVKEYGAHVIFHSSTKNELDNYRAVKLGFTMTEDNTEGGFDEEIHYKRKDKYTRIFGGLEWTLFRNDDRHVASMVNCLLYLYVPLAQTTELRIDGEKQKTEKLDKRKIFFESEVALLSFPLFSKSSGITVGPVFNFSHEGKAKNTYALGGTFRLYIKYNEAIKVQYKFLVDPSDEDKTNTTPFILVNVDGFALLRATGIVK